MQYIDSHAHLCDAALFPDIDNILKRSRQAHVTHIINICTTTEDLEKGIHLQSKYPFIRNAGATTPHDAKEPEDLAFPFFEKAAHAKQLCAIGETGLDYYHKDLHPKIQKEYLIRYLHLANETHLPVIFHCREAFDDLFAITDQELSKKNKAIIHCFTGSLKEAEQVLERGWYISLSGIVTFKKSEDLRLIAQKIPLNQLLIETDAPFLAPQSKRGKTNEPAFVIETASCIAKIKQIQEEEIAKATSENTKRLFHIE